jgi:DNA polymerase III delta prime subunit
VSSRFKIYVIDEAHMVSSAGFNALLKLVEEPPDFVKFVFATTEPEKVLQTIRSRTHHYPFRLLPPGVLRGLLEDICARESVTVEPTVFPLVVRAGGGSARDALSILDQLLAGAGEGGVTYSTAVKLLESPTRRCSTRRATRSRRRTVRESSPPSTALSRPATTRAGSRPTCWNACATCSSSRRSRTPPRRASSTPPPTSLNA